MAESDVRIVLLGKTGVGKSASGNTILGTEEFVEQFSPESVTSHCRKFETKVSGRTVVVVDTPGLFDTKLTNEQMKEEIVKCVYMTVPGPHVFLLVIRLGARFTEEDRNTMKWIRESFSELALKYALVLFTGFDDNVDLEDYIEQSPALEELISKCQGYHAFDNKNKSRAQVNRLITKIDRLVIKANGGQHYTDEMYLEAQRKIKEEEERKVREEEMKRQEKERKREEEQREKVEAMRKELEMQEKQRREEEDIRKRFEEEKRQMLEDRKRREEEARMYERRIEEERKRYEEQDRKRREEERERREIEKDMWERRREEEKIMEQRALEAERARQNRQEWGRREERGWNLVGDVLKKEQERRRIEAEKSDCSIS